MPLDGDQKRNRKEKEQERQRASERARSKEPKSFIGIGKSNVREMAFFNDSYDTNITINSAFLCVYVCCIDFFTSFSSSQFLN